MKKRLLIFAGMLLVSAVLVAVAGAGLKQKVLKPLHLYDDKSVIEVPFLTLNDPMIRYALRTKSESETTPSTETQQPPDPTQPPEPVIELPSVPVTEPPYFEITESWFDDVLFIGDSRTVGLRDYARLGKADYELTSGSRQ